MRDFLALVRARTHIETEKGMVVSKACFLLYLEVKYAKCSSHSADYVGITRRHVLQRTALTLLPPPKLAASPHLIQLPAEHYEM